MIKKKYIIKFETKNLENFDPNLDISLNDIRSMKKTHKENFDFEILSFFDGFIVSCFFDKIFNTFLHDVFAKDHMFNTIYKSKDFVSIVKLFINNVFNSIYNKISKMKTHKKWMFLFTQKI